MQLNEIYFAGYVGKDAESKTTQSGTEGVSFPLCHSRKNKNGEDEKCWVTVQVYGNWISTARLIKKGDNVIVKGTLKISQYKDKNGVDKTFVSILANSLAVAEREEAVPSELPEHLPPKAPQAKPVDDFDIPF